MRFLLPVFLALVAACILLIPVSSDLNAQDCNPLISVIRVSGAVGGTSGNDRSNWAHLSGDGRYVLFESLASDLVPGDGNSARDVFIYDLHAQRTSRLSTASGGLQGNGHSFAHSLSSDGQVAAFESWASNLVTGDRDNIWDVFVHDQASGQTSRVSVAADGAQGNARSTSPVLSGEGRYVAFDSLASNLVPGDTNNTWDVFVHDRNNGTISRISAGSGGVEGNHASIHPALSADGRYVAFLSLASNLVVDDTNDLPDVFIYDRQDNRMTRIPAASAGAAIERAPAYLSFSADGRYLAFESHAADLVSGDSNGVTDVFVYDQQAARIRRVSVAADGSEANGTSANPALSADGRWVVFQSIASNLVAGDSNGTWDIFMADWNTGQLIRISTAGDAEANGSSYKPDVSADGGLVVFTSDASNLVAEDTNAASDIYVAVIEPCQPPIPAPTSLPNAVPQRNYITTQPITLAWNPVTWAVRYEVQVDTERHFIEPPVDQPATTPELELTLDPGTYFWRVRAIRANNTPGAWSAVESFTVGMP